MLYPLLLKIRTRNLFNISKSTYSSMKEIINKQAYIRNIGILAHIDAGK